MRRSIPKKRHATLADIAASTGVTPMTVSRVVNGNGYVSAETREKVLSAVSALNYRRNGLARGLKRQRTDTIGLVLGDIANPFAAELARAVREVMSARGYNVFICVSEHSAREDIAAFESLADHRMDGVIVATRANKLGNNRLAEMIEGGIPVVLIGRDFRHPSADLIAADNLRGGYDATAHLISLGHKNIGFIGVTLTSGVGLRRYHGYLEAMREHGLKVDERLIVGRADDGDQWPGYSTEAMGYEGMKKLLALRKRPTAVFAHNDFTAVGAMSATKEAGLRIPQDIAIVGYDDVPLATHTSPPLTTVRRASRVASRPRRLCAGWSRPRHPRARSASCPASWSSAPRRSASRRENRAAGTSVGAPRRLHAQAADLRPLPPAPVSRPQLTIADTETRL